uniref:Uncharacterized protein n=1 Tax=Anguilla anguilla TaxID=7936 RepID=A0A0E9WL69_ANGAN
MWPTNRDFGGESIWLYLHICSGYLVDEARLPNIGVSTQKQGSRVGINGWQTGQMLPHLLQVLQALLLPLQDGTHPAQSCPLQLLTAVQGVPILHQPHIVLGNIVNQILCYVYLSQGQLVVVFVIQNVHQVCIKWVNVVQLWEVRQYLSKPVMIVLLGKFHFSHVEMPDTMDLIVLMYNCGSFPLSFR